MITIPCPHCGVRDAAEFGYIGERVARPDVDTATAEQWRTYLFMRRNPAGWADEMWLHRSGCGRYLAVSRNTVTGEIRSCRSISFGSGSSSLRSEASGGPATRRDVASPGIQTSQSDVEPAERDRTTAPGEED